MFIFNIKKKVCDVLNYFLLVLMKYENKKAHNMLSLMLNPKFKSLKLVSSFNGSKQIVPMVENDKKWSLFPFPLKCHHVLHLVLKLEIVIDSLNDEFFCLDILKMIIDIF